MNNAYTYKEEIKSNNMGSIFNDKLMKSFCKEYLDVCALPGYLYQ